MLCYYRKLYFPAKSHCFSKWEELSIKKLSTAANTKIKRTSAVSFFFLPTVPAFLLGCGFLICLIHCKLYFPAKSHCFSKWEELSIKKLSTAANTKIKRTSAVSFFFLPTVPAFLSGCGFLICLIHRFTELRKRDCSQSSL